jgi:sulfite reductase (NADPH) hemoprotein beta-component
MYIYDEVDQILVDQRVAQFRDQVDRFQKGDLTDEDFRVFRLQNGLYFQRNAPMLRVAIPYGILSSKQLRTLAYIADHWDKGYGHFTTRQNIQFNWPQLKDTPDILEKLSSVQMHAIQTSGNCIRNTTTDHFAGVAEDEIINPLIWCEVIRQWSMLHPEFAFLPRKFKIAVNGSVNDRAAIGVHDIGLQAIKKNDVLGFEIWVGGGLGRTPIIGKLITKFIPWHDLLTYLQAILRVYNLHGRRDNKYKARIKILVKELTPEVFTKEVNEQWLLIKDGPDRLTKTEIDHIAHKFKWPNYEFITDVSDNEDNAVANKNKSFLRWRHNNVHNHKIKGYASVSASLKSKDSPPGDISAEQMNVLADLSEAYGFGELRISHEQNIILPDIKKANLYPLWKALDIVGLATPNIGLITNIIACPGGDYCNLANTVSIPVATAIRELIDQLDYVHDIGQLDLNISGCMNSCGHHHIGHIGILGVDKAGEEWYQITIGGRQTGSKIADIQTNKTRNVAVIGRVIGRSFPRNLVPHVINQLVQTYLTLRYSESERFIDVVDRLGIEPFKKDVYSAPLLTKLTIKD